MPRTSRRSLLPACVLVVGLVLAGCSKAEQPSSGPSPSTAVATGSASSTASGSSTAEAVRTLTISVDGSTVTPKPSRVTIAQGETLRLVVTADHDDELHAHGFEVEKELTAGQPTTVELTGSEPGLYEVETHHPELRLLQVLVR